MDRDHPRANPVFRVGAFVFRALVGAFTGVVSVGLIATIATEYFGLGVYENSAEGDRFFMMLLTRAAISCAVVAVLFGASEIRGKAGSVMRRGAWGAVAGLLGGAALGTVVGETSRSPKGGAAGLILGMLIGIPLGAIAGGVTATVTTTAHAKQTGLRAEDGVADRELDG